MVGDVDQLGALEPVRAAVGLAQPHVELAELPGEGYLLLPVERLAVPDQHREAVHRPVDLLHFSPRKRIPQVQARSFGDEMRMEGLEADHFISRICIPVLARSTMLFATRPLVGRSCSRKHEPV
jgi:hypothetical protein